jgi:hypothetical protein
MSMAKNKLAMATKKSPGPTTKKSSPKAGGTTRLVSPDDKWEVQDAFNTMKRAHSHFADEGMMNKIRAHAASEMDTLKTIMKAKKSPFR